MIQIVSLAILLQVYVLNVNQDFISMEEHVKFVLNKIVSDATILVNAQDAHQDTH